MAMQLALYKGPATGLFPKLAHALICQVTGSKYSHVELVVDGVCYTASNYEGRVRSKCINLDSGHWDVVDLPDADPVTVLHWFGEHGGQRYDWAGVLRFVLPFLPNSPTRWFCSEACAAALGLDNPGQYTPGALAKLFAPGAASPSI